MRKFGTGAQSYPLSTGNNNNPDLTQGEATTFFLNTVPDRCPSGPLAYLLPFLLLTITGTCAQPSSGGTPVYMDDLVGCLIDSINWSGTFFGTPVSANYVFGRNMAVTEYISGGYRYAMRRRPRIPATGSNQFKLSVLIPAASCMLGGLMRETAQLAALYKGSQIDINVADASVLDGISTGATFSDISARCSAIVYPTNELVLGTPVETVLHTIVASSNSNQVTVNGFGTATALTNVEKKGGVVFLGELTNRGIQNGVFAAEDITQFAMPWRGQIQQKHIEALLSPSLLAMPNSRPQTLPTPISGGDSEFAGYPYTMGNSDFSPITDMDETGLRVFSMVYGDNDLQLADLQTADEDQDFFLDVSGGFDSGSHQILGMYAKRWQESFRNAWVQTITAGGPTSLAAYVLGKDWAKANIGQRLPQGRHIVTGDEMTYLAWQLA